MNMEDNNRLMNRLDLALAARSRLINLNYNAAWRLFAGFYEGYPDLAADIYGSTLVLHSYGQAHNGVLRVMDFAQEHLLQKLPWVDCVLQKIHTSSDNYLQQGKVTFGSHLTSQVQEHGVWYATDLRINRDASLYLDTRNLRRWLIDHAHDLTVLNLFAYTGSLGVAALAGGAKRIVQVDRSRKFMALANRSCELNHFDTQRMELRPQDFFSAVAYYKKSGELFDLVIVDPPYQSTTGKGKVNLVSESIRVVNKVRPLIADGGAIITINNALFLKGSDYLSSLERLCQDGFLAIEKIIPVPEDFIGYKDTIVTPPPVDPAPFNHPTKIVLLRVKRRE